MFSLVSATKFLDFVAPTSQDFSYLIVSNNCAYLTVSDQQDRRSNSYLRSLVVSRNEVCNRCYRILHLDRGARRYGRFKRRKEQQKQLLRPFFAHEIISECSFVPSQQIRKPKPKTSKVKSVKRITEIRNQRSVFLFTCAVQVDYRLIS